MTPQTLTAKETTNGTILPQADSLWRVSVERYHALIEAGAFTEDDPVELLQGWIAYRLVRQYARTHYDKR